MAFNTFPVCGSFFNSSSICAFIADAFIMSCERKKIANETKVFHLRFLYFAMFLPLAILTSDYSVGVLMMIGLLMLTLFYHSINGQIDTSLFIYLEIELQNIGLMNALITIFLDELEEPL